MLVDSRVIRVIFFCSFSSGLFFQVISFGSLLIQGFHDLAADGNPKSMFLCLIFFHSLYSLSHVKS